LQSWQHLLVPDLTQVFEIWRRIGAASWILQICSKVEARREAEYQSNLAWNWISYSIQYYYASCLALLHRQRKVCQGTWTSTSFSARTAARSSWM